MTTYYVDNSSPNASDSNAGTSPDAPLLTLNAVNQLQLQPGDTVAFKAGTTYSVNPVVATNQNVVVSYNGIGSSGGGAIQNTGGVQSAVFTGDLATDSTIGGSAPSITSVTMAPAKLIIGSVGTAMVTTSADGDTDTLAGGSIDGFKISSVTKVAEGLYQVQFTVGSGGTDIASGTPVPVSLQFQSSTGIPSNTYSGTVSLSTAPASTTGPNLLSTTVVGNSIELSYDQALDGTQSVSPTDFQVSVNGTPVHVSEVDINSAARTATLRVPAASLVISASGTASAPITFTSYGNGPAPVINDTASGLGYSDAIQVNGASNIVINGLAVNQAQEAAVNIASTSSHVTVENMAITNVGEGLLINGTDNLVTNNYIHDLHMIVDTPKSVNSNDDYGANGVVFGGNDNTASYNTIVDAAAPSYDYGTDGGGFELFGSPTNININNNLVENSNGFVESGGYGGNISNVSITDNQSINSGQFAVLHNGGGSFGGTLSNIDLGYNTIVNTNATSATGGIVYLDASPPAGTVNFHNNIVSLNAGDSVYKQQQGNYHSNNIYYLYSKSTHIYNNWSMALASGESLGKTIYQGIAATALPAVLNAVTPTEGDASSAVGQQTAALSAPASAPVVQGVSIGSQTLDIGSTGTVTINVAASSDTYSLVSGFVGGFMLTNLQKVNATTYSAQFLVTANAVDRAATDALSVSLVLATSAGAQNLPYVTPITQAHGVIDAHRPVYLSGTVDGSNIALNYNEALDGVNLPPLSAFAVVANGVSDAVTGVSVTGQSVNLTLATPVIGGAFVQLAYTDPTSADDALAIQDLAGNDAVSLKPQTLFNTTYNPNAPSAVLIDANAPVFVGGTANGATLALTYNETLDSTHLPLPNAFTVTSGGSAIAVTNVSVLGRVVTLTLAAPVGEEQAVTLAYANPSASNSLGQVFDANGNPAPALAPQTLVNVTPPTPLSVSLSPGALKIGSTGTVTIDVVPSPDVYSLVSGSVDGFALTNLQQVNASTYSAQFTVTAASTDQASGAALPVSLVLQDASGYQNPAFVTPTTPITDPIDATLPVMTGALVSGSTLVIAYNKALNAANLPAASAYSVTADGAAIAVDGVSVDPVGQTVTLSLAAPVAFGQTVTLGYTDPSTPASTAGALQDYGGNDAPSFAAQAIGNVTPEPPPVITNVSIAANPLAIGSVGTAIITVAPEPDTYSLVSGSVDGFALSNLQQVNASTYSAQFTVTEGSADLPVGSTLPVSLVLQDSAGDQNAAYGAPTSPIAAPIDVTAPVLQTAFVNGTTLVLNYNKALDSIDPPPATAFSVSANGVTIGVKTVAVNSAAQTVTLGLATAVTTGQTVFVNYTDPPEGLTQDILGNDAASLVEQPVINDTPAAVVQSTPTPASSGSTASVQSVPSSGATDTSSSTVATAPVVSDTPPAAVSQDVPAASTSPVAAADPVSSSDPTTSDPGASDPASFSAPSNQTVAGPTPQVAFDPAATFQGQNSFTLTGTASDPSGIASVELFATIDGLPTSIGSAAIAADGTWTITDNAGPGTLSSINAVVTDGAGNQTTQPADFDLTSGVTGEPYKAYQTSYDSAGNLLGQTFFTWNGTILYTDTYAAEADGGGAYTTSGGSYFKYKPYFAYVDTFDAAGVATEEDIYYKDGTQTVQGLVGHQTLHSIANDVFYPTGKDNVFVFTPGFGADLVTNFHAKGAGHDTLDLAASDFSNIAEILRDTHNQNGSAVITDPVSGDTITLQSVTKAELKAHPQDFKLI